MKNITIENVTPNSDYWIAIIDVRYKHKRIRIFQRPNAKIRINPNYEPRHIIEFEGGLLAAQAWAIEKLESEVE